MAKMILQVTQAVLVVAVVVALTAAKALVMDLLDKDILVVQEHKIVMADQAVVPEQLGLMAAQAAQVILGV